MLTGVARSDASHLPSRQQSPHAVIVASIRNVCTSPFIWLPTYSLLKIDIFVNVALTHSPLDGDTNYQLARII